MAGSITMALHTAKDGLLAMQSALGTVSQNVANVNTPGYSRKIQHLETRVVAGSGAGVQLSEVRRSIDEGLLKDVRRENGELYTSESQLSYYQRIEELFGAPGDNTSIAHMMNTLSTSLEGLSKSPNRSVEQGEFILAAVDMTEQLESMSREIQELRLQSDVELAEVVSEINDHLSEIADLNDKIIRNQTVSNDVTDLKDKRDIALNELSKLIDIQYFERSSGEVAVFTQGGNVLVDSDAVSISHVAAASVGPATTHAEGNFNGIFLSENVSSEDITTNILGGKAKGLIEIRDGFLNDIQREMDELAQVLKDTVNQVHNAGTSVPGRSSMTGTRTFIETSGTGTYDQTITISGQVRLLLSDSDGNQLSTATLDSAEIMGGNGPHTITDLATGIDTWLSNEGYASATVAVNSEGKFEINMNNSSVYFNIYEESTTTAGTQENATITFDGTGQSLGSETHEGFSSFFGLNDFFVTGQVNNTFESDILSNTATMTTGTLYFHDQTSGAGAGNEIGSLTIQPGWSLEEMAAAINDNSTLNTRITADVIPEGSGHRLRISHNSGEELYIGSTPTSALNNIGWHPSEIGMSQSLSVRSDIEAAPGLISTAQVQFDSDIGASGGEYRILDTDNTNVLAMVNAFTSPQDFDAAGRLIVRNQSLTDYSTNIIGEVASATNSLNTSNETQQRLVDSLSAKSDNIKGVNLDEELSQLILFEQAYSASARIISTIKEMFDTLESAVGR